MYSALNLDMNENMKKNLLNEMIAEQTRHQTEKSDDVSQKEQINYNKLKTFHDILLHLKTFESENEIKQLIHSSVFYSH
jgi:hypothetical protein